MAVVVSSGSSRINSVGSGGGNSWCWRRRFQMVVVMVLALQGDICEIFGVCWW